MKNPTNTPNEIFDAAVDNYGITLHRAVSVTDLRGFFAAQIWLLEKNWSFRAMNNFVGPYNLMIEFDMPRDENDRPLVEAIMRAYQ